MKSKGFAMVEAIVAVTIAASLILVLAGVNYSYLRLSLGQSDKIQASFLAEEGIEVVRFLRDTSWDIKIAVLTPGTFYYPAFSSGTWQLNSASSTIGIFERKVKVDQVLRDANDDITSSGGTLDPNTLLVTSVVTWQEKGVTQNKTISTYITDLFVN